MPMDKTSTLHSSRFNRTDSKKAAAKGAKRTTLAFIRQFARTYMAVDNLPGFVLN